MANAYLWEQLTAQGDSLISVFTGQNDYGRTVLVQSIKEEKV